MLGGIGGVGIGGNVINKCCASSLVHHQSHHHHHQHHYKTTTTTKTTNTTTTTTTITITTTTTITNTTTFTIALLKLLHLPQKCNNKKWDKNWQLGENLNMLRDSVSALLYKFDQWICIGKFPCKYMVTWFFCSSSFWSNVDFTLQNCWSRQTLLCS